MSSFIDKRNKVQTINSHMKENENDINKLNATKIIKEPFNFNKVAKVIHLLIQEPITAVNPIDAHIVQQDFTNLPDWALISFKLVPVFYSDSGVIINPAMNYPLLIDDNYFSWAFHSSWKQIDKTQRLTVTILGSLFNYQLSRMNLYLDLDLIFYNPNEYDTLLKRNY
jgi:hypothetical protein